MQLAEQERIDIDAPITDYLADFHIVIPFEGASPVTLRQLMCHRSGMVRESPVGGYLDGSEAGIAASIASLEPCVLVNPPNTKTRYSNIGVTLVRSGGGSCQWAIIRAVSSRPLAAAHRDDPIRLAGRWPCA